MTFSECQWGVCMVKRDWKKVWILGILTGGLYNWYIVNSMLNDVKVMEDKTNSKQSNMFLFFLLSICTGSLFAFIMCYSYHKKALKLAEIYNVKLSINSPFLFSIIAMYIPVISFLIPINNHNKLIEGYEQSYAYRENA